MGFLVARPSRAACHAGYRLERPGARQRPRPASPGSQVIEGKRATFDGVPRLASSGSMTVMFESAVRISVNAAQCATGERAMRLTEEEPSL